MKNHVFLLQVHKDPYLVLRILKRMEASNHYFIINIDKKSKLNSQFITLLKDVKNVIYNEPINVQHGGFSQIQCTLAQMRLAIEFEVKFDYFHTLSGQDYPCVTTECFDMFFENNVKSYMMLDTEEEVFECRKVKYANRMLHWNFADFFNSPWMNKIRLTEVVNRLTHDIPKKCNFMDEIWGGGIGFRCIEVS